MTYSICQTTDSIYSTHIDYKRLRVKIKLPLAFTGCVCLSRLLETMAPCQIYSCPLLFSTFREVMVVHRSPSKLHFYSHTSDCKIKNQNCPGESFFNRPLALVMHSCSFQARGPKLLCVLNHSSHTISFSRCTIIQDTNTVNSLNVELIRGSSGTGWLRRSWAAQQRFC